MRNADRRGRAWTAAHRCRCASRSRRSARAPARIAAIVVAALVVFAAEAITAYASPASTCSRPAATSRRSTATQLTDDLRASARWFRCRVASCLSRRCSTDASFTARLREQRARLRAQRLAAARVRRAGAGAGRCVGLLSFGVGLIAIFPLLPAASYAAWKDIWAVTDLDVPAPARASAAISKPSKLPSDGFDLDAR